MPCTPVRTSRADARSSLLSFQPRTIAAAFAPAGEGSMTDETIPRRKFLVGAGLAGTAVATRLTQTEPAQAQPAAPPAATTPPAPQAEPLLLLNETEHAFVVAAVDTIIPADEVSAS